MAKTHQNVWIAPLILLALVAFAIGMWLQSSNQSSIDPTFALNTESATVLSMPRDIKPFDLIKHDGTHFTQENLKGQWSLMFFGFTSCPHVCPGIISELRKTSDALSTMGSQQPQYIMVSIDPARDSVERMKQYVTSFHQDFIGLRGESSQIKQMTQELGIVYMKVMAESDAEQGNYDIDHSGTLLMFNPDGKLHALFSMPHRAEKIATDVALLTYSDSTTALA